MSARVSFLPCYAVGPLGIQRIANAPKCQAKTTVDASQRGRNKAHGRDCVNMAKVEINGKKLCLRHAERVALLMVLKGAK